MRANHTERIGIRLTGDLAEALEKHVDKIIKKDPTQNRRGLKSEVTRKALELFLHVRGKS